MELGTNAAVLWGAQQGWKGAKWAYNINMGLKGSPRGWREGKKGMECRAVEGIYI